MRRGGKIQPKKAFAVVVDGETEKWYLQMLKEEREKKNSTSSLQKFLSYWKQFSEQDKQDKVVVIVNNPCLEYWFLLHFRKTSRVFTACAGAEKEVSQYLKGYEKTEKFFKKSNNDIYKQLKPLLQTAIKNATALGSFEIKEYKKAKCEMPLLFKELKVK